jgi:hypothetical protein
MAGWARHRHWMRVRIQAFTAGPEPR